MALARESNVDVGNREQIFHYGNGTEPEGLDPHIVTGVSENHIISALFEGLVGIEPHTLEPIADCGAERWEVSPDGLTYTFYLRPEATWSNGEPVRASDYVYSYHRMLIPEMAAKYGYMLYPLRNAEAYNLTRLGFILCGLDAEFPASWDALAEVDFAGDASAASPFNQKGLDRLSAEEFAQLAADPTLFEWPETVSDPVRAEIVDRLRAHRDAGSPDLWAKANVGVVAESEFVLRFELEKPAPYLLGMLNHYSWYPVHPDTIESHGGMTKRDSLWTRPAHMVSNGAYSLEEWIVNRHIRVVKREDYWDAEKMRLEEIFFYPIDDVETEQRAFRDGYIHVTSTVPTHRVDYNRENFPNQLRFDAYLGTYYYRMHVAPPSPDDSPSKRAAREVLSDKRIRRALAISIDREAICGFLGGGQMPAYTFVPPDTGGYRSSFELKRDPAEARRLLAEAGYPDGKGFPEVSFLYNTSEGHKQIAEIIQQMWKRELNIDIALVNQEWKVFLDTTYRLDYDLARAGWIGDYVDPNTFLDMWLSGSGNNQTSFDSAEYDSLIDQASRTFDMEERLRIFQRAEAVLLDELPVLPIYFYVSSKMIQESVRGWYPNLLDRHPYKYVYLEPID